MMNSMIDQDKIDAVTERLTGFTPISVARAEVVAWMRENPALGAYYLRAKRASEGRLIFTTAAHGEWALSPETWKTLYDESLK